MTRPAERGGGGGAGGQIAPGPEVVGAPLNFSLGPRLFLARLGIYPFLGRNICILGAKNRNLV
jgi:hypothetical protein